MRFQNVPIPAGATVTDARVVFEIDSISKASSSGYDAPIDLIIVGENMIGSRLTFNLGNQPEDRLANQTTATVDWETSVFPAVNEMLTTANIAPILNELVSDAG